MKEIGLLTIGQAPRMDITQEIEIVLGKNVNIKEKGALDGLTLQEVQKLCPGEPDGTLVTRMADGTSVKVAEEHVIPRLQNKIHQFENEGIKIIYLACTGEFPSVSSKVLMIRPQKVLYHVVGSMAVDRSLAVLIPDENQTAAAERRWGGLAKDIIVKAVSPFGEASQIERVSNEISNNEVDLVIMDCMGYSIKMKDTVHAIVRKPVINARSLTAKIVGDII